MPVLITITTVSLIFRGGKGASFLSPAGLRTRVEKLPEGDGRELALSLVTRLEGLAQDYEDGAKANIAEYVDLAAEWHSSADALMQIRMPMDPLRTQTLMAVVQLRESLLEALTPEEWKNVFGKPPNRSSGKGQY